MLNKNKSQDISVKTIKIQIQMVTIIRTKITNNLCNLHFNSFLNNDKFICEVQMFTLKRLQYCFNIVKKLCQEKKTHSLDATRKYVKTYSPSNAVALDLEEKIQKLRTLN